MLYAAYSKYGGRHQTLNYDEILCHLLRDFVIRFSVYMFRSFSSFLCISIIDPCSIFKKIILGKPSKQFPIPHLLFLADYWHPMLARVFEYKSTWESVEIQNSNLTLPKTAVSCTANWLPASQIVITQCNITVLWYYIVTICMKKKIVNH